MAYRFRQRYQAVQGKRAYLRETGAYSVPNEPGAKVAILVPFIAEVVHLEHDKLEDFEKQTDELMVHYAAQDRDPFYVMGATPADFEKVMTDRAVAGVVVEGFGNFSATAVPFSKDRADDPRYGYLDWQHLAGMADHLKLGNFVMYTCCGFMRPFNAPLASGVVSSFSNIYTPTGLAIQAAGMQENAPLIRPITTEEELSYDAIREQFKAPRPVDNIPGGVPAPAYIAARGLYHLVRRPEPPPPEPEMPPSTPIPYPDLRQYLPYYETWHHNGS